MLRIWLLFVLGIFTVEDGYAQAVTVRTQYEYPARTVTHDISRLQNAANARVVVIRSNQTIVHGDDDGRQVNQAVVHWELFLSGLQIPYSVRDDVNLNRRISKKTLVLVLPAVESISELQRGHILDFIRNGGGIIASGRTGVYDENGWPGKSSFLTKIFGVEVVDSFPAQSFGFYQTIESHSSLSVGISPGFELNVAPRTRLPVVRPGSSTSLGKVKTYATTNRDRFEDLTTMVTGSHGKGRFLWTGFLPQDISRNEEQQENYQRLMINALAHVSGSLTVSVSRWPAGKDMALTVAALPSPGFDARTYLVNTDHFLTLIEDANIPASFYFASDEITTFPSLYRRAISSGSEIGLTADNDDLMIDSSLTYQAHRLSTAIRSLRLSRAHGVYPPGGFLDGNTIRALDRVGAAYVIRAESRPSVPGILDWWNFVDFRESFDATEDEDPVADAITDSESYEIERFSSRITNFDEDSGSRNKMRGRLAISIVPFSASFGIDFEAAYRHFKNSGGHFVLPFFPEQYGPYSRASDNLSHTLKIASEDNTWITTASDALIWWRTRANLKPVLKPAGQNEIYIVLENSLDHTVHDVVLDVYMNMETTSSVHVSPPARIIPTSELARDMTGGVLVDFSKPIQILISDVLPGQNRIEINW